MKDVFYDHDFGKVAPWVDLVNSEEWDGFGNFSERLESSEWLESFLRHWNFEPLRGEPLPRRQLDGLRKVMRRAVASVARSGDANLTSRELQEINRALGLPTSQQLIREPTGLSLEAVPERRGWAWVLAETARGFAEWLLRPEASRIKICANDECRWLFYDPTKARIKRWCSGKSCGNRMRVRRARHKTMRPVVRD
jgi:hypothetical protein